MQGNQNARQHGLSSAKRALSEWGKEAIDGRSSMGRALAVWRQEIVRDLGGEGQLSAQQHTVLDVVVRTKLLLDGIDGFILSRGSIVNKKRRCLYPVVIQRQSLADSLVRHLQTLGLDKKTAQVPTLSEYIAAKKQEEK